MLRIIRWILGLFLPAPVLFVKGPPDLAWLDLYEGARFLAADPNRLHKLAAGSRERNIAEAIAHREGLLAQLRIAEANVLADLKTLRNAARRKP